MWYHVSGQDRTDGHRRELRIEADSRAAAEKKGAQSGLDVSRVHELREEIEAPVAEPKVWPSMRSSVVVLLLLVLAVIAVFIARYFGFELWSE